MYDVVGQEKTTLSHCCGFLSSTFSVWKMELILCRDLGTFFMRLEMLLLMLFEIPWLDVWEWRTSFWSPVVCYILGWAVTCLSIIVTGSDNSLNFRLQYYKLIEECITQIVLHKSGVDPDFRYTKRFDIDVDPLIGKISTNSQSQSNSISWAQPTV